MRSRSTSRPRSTRAFTLIEVLVTLGILTAVLALGLFVSLDVYRGYSYRSERSTIVALLTRARSHAMANVGQSAWGVCENAGGGTYLLFRGTGYAAGAFVDEALPVAPAGQVAGIPACAPGAGVVFSALWGTTTPVTITVLQTGGPQTIAINHEGTIIW